MSKTVLVTGAGRGLGFCIAKQHLEAGDRVFALEYLITEELIDLSLSSERMTVMACDIGSTESVMSAAKAVQAETAVLDMLYNVAGIFRFDEKVHLAQTELDRCTEMYNINAVGALRVVKAVWSLLQQGAVVINISSEAGSIGACYRDMEYSYCMSKAALNMGARILGNELKKTDGRVINLHPGWMRTAMGGAEAAASDRSLSPEESAGDIIGIARDAKNFPEELMYMEHNRNPLPW